MPETGENIDAASAEDAPVPKDTSAVENLIDSVCRCVAVTAVLLTILGIILLICAMLVEGAMHTKTNWKNYKAGGERLVKLLDGAFDAVARKLFKSDDLDKQLKKAYSSILDKAQEAIWRITNMVIVNVSGSLTSAGILLLYVLFWLLRPLPLTGKASDLVRSYIWKKTLVSFLFGLCIALLFTVLGIDLAILFGVVSFFLNYVPEFGALLSMLVPIPVILLDGRIDRPFGILGLALAGQLFLKFLFGNMLEVRLIQNDAEMNIHPVWIILGLNYFGFVWGPIGMLISVPLMAMAKTALYFLREEVLEETASAPNGVSLLIESLLACIEGRREKLHMASPSQPLLHEPPKSYSS